jgi:hypothetical protein
MTALTYEILRPLERIKVFTPLGIHFWDPVHDTPVSDGLSVTARPKAAPGSVIPAFRTGSGVYAFQHLPGLHEHEYPAESHWPETNPPETKPKPFTIEVADQQRRYLPVVFAVDLPLPYEGIYRPAANGDPPANSPPRFYLFSAPTRTAAPGIAAVRAQLVEHDTKHPAAHAVLEVEFKGRKLEVEIKDEIVEIEIKSKKWYGIADSRGGVAVLFPYPTFIGSLGTSSEGTPPVEQEWELTVRVRYSSTLSAPHTELPDLYEICRQKQGSIWREKNGSAVKEWSQQLCFGQELVLRTEDLSSLLISPGATLP